MIDLLAAAHRVIHVPDSSFARPVQWVAVIAWALATFVNVGIYIASRGDIRAVRDSSPDVRYRALTWMRDIRTRMVATAFLTAEASIWLFIATPQPGLAVWAAGLNTVAALLVMMNAIFMNRAESHLLKMER